MCRRICEKEGKAVAVSEKCDGGWRERWTLVLTVESDRRVNRLASLSAPLSFFLLLSAVLFSFHISFLAHSGSFSSTCCAGRKVENRSCEITDRHFLLSPSLSPSLPLSSCVCRTLSRGGGVEEERKRFIFILSSFSILPQGKNNLTSFILHLTVSPSLSPPPPLPPPLSLTHSKDYGSRERSTSVRTRKWIYWFSLL